ncbi:hypothetical protein I5W21_09890 [Stenotrophomonas maltophilia]|nr:hypothetical protein [Stenotrophomonas maltophilia]
MRGWLGIPEFHLQLPGLDIQAIAELVGQLGEQPVLLSMQAALHLRFGHRGAGDVVHTLRAIRPWVCLIGLGCGACQSHHNVPAPRIVHPDAGQAGRVPRFQAVDQRPLLGGGDGIAGVALVAAKERP